MYKALSLIICIALLGPIVSSSYAVTIDNQSNITQLDNGTKFYFESTETYNLAMTQGKTCIDYAIKYFDQEDIYYGIIELQNLSVNYTKENDDLFKIIKDSLVNRATNLPLEAINVNRVMLHNNNVYATIPLSDKNKIDNAIRSLGHPSAYEDKLIGTYTNGVLTGQIFETLYYTYYESDSFFIAAATTISIVSAIVGLAPATLLGIMAFTATAYGTYVTVSDSTLKKYQAGILYTKSVYVNSTYVMPAGWQVVWNAYVGINSSAALIEKTNNMSDEYALSNVQLINLAFSKY